MLILKKGVFDRMGDNILKQGIKILKPYEFDLLLQAIPKQQHKNKQSSPPEKIQEGKPDL